MAGTGLIVAATLTPFVGTSSEAPISGLCDLSRLGFAPLSRLVRVGDESLNVLLFIPLGLAIGLLPASSARRALVLGGLALPFLVELTQALVPPLGRGCESADVIDNLSGLLIGLAIGLVAGWLARLVRPRAVDGAP